MGHFYDKDGSPRYTVPYADPRKGERDTTLRDAKKLGLLPSVTTITGIVGSEALVNYKLNQLLDAVILHPYDDSCSVERWRSAVLEVSREHSKKASERGSELHDSLEKYYKTGKIDKKNEGFIKPAIDLIDERFGPNMNWVAEQAFGCVKEGFGGKVDLYSPRGVILDFKTKTTSDVSKMVPYAGHHMQSAAYQEGLYHLMDVVEKREHDTYYEETVDIRRFNLFISTEQEGILNLTESTDFDTDWAMFAALRDYWVLANKYDPRNL